MDPTERLRQAHREQRQKLLDLLQLKQSNPGRYAAEVERLSPHERRALGRLEAEAAARARLEEMRGY